MAWIRQKPETEPSGPTQPSAAPVRNEPARTAYRETTPMSQIVNIGKSVEIKGELTGNEDLTIEGKVEGKIVLKDHTLRIGTNGQIKADIEAKEVVVAGELYGNVTAETKVEISDSGSMEGDIKAPRLVLADGGRFKGGVDMAPKEVTPASVPIAHPTAPKKEATKDMASVGENRTN